MNALSEIRRQFPSFQEPLMSSSRHDARALSGESHAVGSKASFASFEYSRVEINSMSARYGTKVLSQSLQARFEGLRLTQQAGPAFETVEPPSADEVANRVLGFVENRMKQEAGNGASEERLENLMKQARVGVEKGYAEARKIIDDLGLMNDELDASISDGYGRIQAGLDKLSSQYTPALNASVVEAELIPATAAENVGANPVERPDGSRPNAPMKSRASAAPVHQMNYQASSLSARAEQVGIQIQTRDGDVVTINLREIQASRSSTQLSATQGAKGFGFETSYSNSQYASGEYTFSVEGELDQAEVRALEDLMVQIEGVAGYFFNGDLGSAFNSALNIGFNGDELAAFSVNMTRTSLSQQAGAYREISGLGSAGSDRSGKGQSFENASLKALQKYARELVASLNQASAFPEPRQLVKSVFDRMLETKAYPLGAKGLEQERFAEFTHKLLDRL